jgi:hypothetical protein
VVAVYNALSDEPDRIAAVDRTFVEFVTSADEGTPGGPAALAASTCSWSPARRARRAQDLVGLAPDARPPRHMLSA